MEGENLEPLKESIQQQAADIANANPEIFVRKTEYDMEIKPEEVTVELAKKLKKLEPFGEANPKPRFMMRDVIMKNVNFMGKDETHARFYVSQNNHYVNCVFFRRAQEYKNKLFSGQPHDLIGSLSYQIWNGQERVQFIIEEIL